MSAIVTKRHREDAASCVYAGGPAVTAWIKSGRAGAKLDPDLPRIARALADIEAEALATRAGGGEGERERPWVKCSERMPGEEEPVWLFQVGWGLAEGYRELGTWRAPEGWRHKAMEPTHWKPRYVEPVPAPPVGHPEPGTPEEKP